MQSLIQKIPSVRNRQNRSMILLVLERVHLQRGDLLDEEGRMSDEIKNTLTA